MEHIMKTKCLLIGLCAMIGFTQIAYAETNFGKQIPSADAVINALNPGTSSSSPDSDYEGDVNPDSTSRMIDMGNLGGKPKPARTKKGKTKKIVAKHARPKRTETALSMEILFGYNSSELSNTAKAQLRPVGEALASGKLKNLSFVVEGHTDGVGGAAYNRILSEQRAAAVKAFLVSNFNLSGVNIQIEGKGESDLLYPHDPDNEANRRVRIIARQ